MSGVRVVECVSDVRGGVCEWCEGEGSGVRVRGVV